MNPIRNYYVKLPLACGVDEELAAEFERHLGALYDIDARIGAFDRKPGQSVENRMRLAWIGWEDLVVLAYLKSLIYGKRLGIFMAASYAYNKKKEGDAFELDTEASELRILEPNFPKISALMTVSDASTVGLAGPLSSWN